jgi:Tfp pilus assembly protein PilV
MANKARGVAFLMLSIVLIGFLVYQVNHYMAEQNEIKASYQVANEKLLSAEEHFSNAKASADKATEAFNSIK